MRTAISFTLLIAIFAPMANAHLSRTQFSLSESRLHLELSRFSHGRSTVTLFDQNRSTLWHDTTLDFGISQLLTLALLPEQGPSTVDMPRGPAVFVLDQSVLILLENGLAVQVARRPEWPLDLHVTLTEGLISNSERPGETSHFLVLWKRTQESALRRRIVGQAVWGIELDFTGAVRSMDLDMFNELGANGYALSVALAEGFSRQSTEIGHDDGQSFRPKTSVMALAREIVPGVFRSTNRLSLAPLAPVMRSESSSINPERNPRELDVLDVREIGSRSEVLLVHVRGGHVALATEDANGWRILRSLYRPDESERGPLSRHFPFLDEPKVTVNGDRIEIKHGRFVRQLSARSLLAETEGSTAGRRTSCLAFFEKDVD